MTKTAFFLATSIALASVPAFTTASSHPNPNLTPDPKPNQAVSADLPPYAVYFNVDSSHISSQERKALVEAYTMHRFEDTIMSTLQNLVHGIVTPSTARGLFMGTGVSLEKSFQSLVLAGASVPFPMYLVHNDHGQILSYKVPKPTSISYQQAFDICYSITTKHQRDGIKCTVHGLGYFNDREFDFGSLTKALSNEFSFYGITHFSFLVSAKRSNKERSSVGVLVKITRRLES